MRASENQLRRIIFAVSATFTLAVGSIAAQERYVRAEMNERSELVITTSTGERIVLGKYDDEYVAGMDGESNPSAPAWVIDVRRAQDSETYQCSTSLDLEARHGRRDEDAEPANQLERALQQAFSAKNPKVTYAKVIELRSLGMGEGPYVMLGWGIRPDWKFEGSFDDELFG